MRDPNYQNTQTIQTPQYNQPQRKSGLNTGYISTIPGLISLLLIVRIFLYSYKFFLTLLCLIGFTLLFLG